MTGEAFVPLRIFEKKKGYIGTFKSFNTILQLDQRGILLQKHWKFL